MGKEVLSKLLQGGRRQCLLRRGSTLQAADAFAVVAAAHLDPFHAAIGIGGLVGAELIRAGQRPRLVRTDAGIFRRNRRRKHRLRRACSRTPPGEIPSTCGPWPCRQLRRPCISGAHPDGRSAPVLRPTSAALEAGWLARRTRLEAMELCGAVRMPEPCRWRATPGIGWPGQVEAGTCRSRSSGRRQRSADGNRRREGHLGKAP